MATTTTTVCLALVAIICAPVCSAAEELPPAALSSIKKTCPEVLQRPWHAANGDLNGDGVADAAVIVSCKSTEGGTGQSQEIIVTYGQVGGSYKIAHRSEAWSWNGREEVELEIKNKLLVFSSHCAYNCSPLNWAASYKFKIRQNKLILVGEDRSTSTRSAEDAEFEDGDKSSINYLTGKMIYSSKGTGQVNSEKKFSFQIKVPLVFSKFNFETCQENASCVAQSMTMRELEKP